MVAPRGQGRGKSHPIKMEMSWEGPALLDPSCWSHCAYSLANFHKHRLILLFRWENGPYIPPKAAKKREDGLAPQEGIGLGGRDCRYAWCEGAVLVSCFAFMQPH